MSYPPFAIDLTMMKAMDGIEDEHFVLRDIAPGLEARGAERPASPVLFEFRDPLGNDGRFGLEGIYIDPESAANQNVAGRG